MKRVIKIAAVVFLLITSALPISAEDGADEVILTPKVLVESYECISLEEDASDKIIRAGDRMQVKVTLVNTSYIELVQNMTVTASAPTDNFILLSVSDTQYVRYLYAGSKVDVIYESETKADMPA